jgi:hypothetical protein
MLVDCCHLDSCKHLQVHCRCPYLICRLLLLLCLLPAAAFAQAQVNGNGQAISTALASAGATTAQQCLTAAPAPGPAATPSPASRYAVALQHLRIRMTYSSDRCTALSMVHWLAVTAMSSGVRLTLNCLSALHHALCCCSAYAVALPAPPSLRLMALSPPPQCLRLPVAQPQVRQLYFCVCMATDSSVHWPWLMHGVSADTVAVDLVSVMLADAAVGW